MKIPCNPESENAFLQNSSSWPSLLDYGTVLRLVKKYGTPLLIGRKSLVQHRFQAIQRELPNVEIYYAVKANSDRALLTVLHKMGAGFDVASEGECERVREVCGSLRNTVFSNPCKTEQAIHRAYEFGCRKFVFDCQSELEKLIQLPVDAGLHLRVAVPAGSCRVNLSQRFGAEIDQVELLGAYAALHGRVISGIAFHVGSQATDPKDFEVAFQVASVARRLLQRCGHKIECINFGGGFPVDYGSFDFGQYDSPQSSRMGRSVNNCPIVAFRSANERHFRGAKGDDHCPNEPKSFEKFIDDYLRKVSGYRVELNADTSIQWMAEPGRIVVAEAVTLITSVIGVKTLAAGKPLYTIDDGVYGSFSGRYFPPDHFRFFPMGAVETSSASNELEDVLTPSMICGPSCDGGDVLGESQPMPSLRIGSLLQVPMMGAYTGVGASRFNGLRIARRVWIE